MTNFERIKNMSAEEFASIFGGCMMCAYVGNCTLTECDDGYLKYLNQEVGE